MKSPNGLEPILFVEPEKRVSKDELKTTLLKQAQKFKITKAIKKIKFKNSFPVDVRHNAKIKRDVLAQYLKKS